MKRFFLFPAFLIFFLPSQATSEDKFYLQHPKNYEKFLADKYLHSPVKEKNCSACHISLEEVKKLTASGNALCYTCHKELEKEIMTKKTHSLIKISECVTCHNVHSGNNRALLNETGKDCSSCHDPADLKRPHFGIVSKKGRCTYCHTPHTSTKDKLMMEAGHSLFFYKSCKACHLPTGPDGKPLVVAPGRKLCFICHGDFKDLEKKKVVHAVFSDCTFCHSAHATKEKKMLLKKVNVICYDCHLEESFKEHPVAKHPVYLTGKTEDGKRKTEKSGFNCLSCHNPHASDNRKMLNDIGKDCTNCHKPGEKKILQAHSQIVVKKDTCAKCHTSRKPVSQHPDFAKKNCFACHPKNPREGKVQLIKSGKELCYLCHPGIKTDLEKKYSHGIVKDEKCSTCHEVHFANYKSLLNETGDNCGTCHDPTDLKKTHFGVIAKKESCTKCHQPHGSDKQKLLLTKGHPFIYDKTCEPCHEKSTPEGKYRLIGKGEKLCFMCHANIEDSLKKKFVHQVAGECRVCHLAHLSQGNKLLLKNGEPLCTDCHWNITGHPVVRHPIRDVIDPRFNRKKTPLTCLSCHNLHGADYRGLLFANPATGEFCLSCHKK